MVADSINGEPIVCGGYNNTTFANETMEKICNRNCYKNILKSINGNLTIRHPYFTREHMLFQLSVMAVGGSLEDIIQIGRRPYFAARVHYGRIGI